MILFELCLLIDFRATKINQQAELKIKFSCPGREISQNSRKYTLPDRQ